MLDAQGAVLTRIRRHRWLPFTRLDLEALIRVVAYMRGPYAMEPALRYYDERYCPSRIAAKPDPTPRLTKQFGDSVELRIWALDPANFKGILDLNRLLGWAERSTSRNDSTALFRPLTGIVASIAAADPASAAPHNAADFTADQVFRDLGDAAPGEPESRTACHGSGGVAGAEIEVPMEHGDGRAENRSFPDCDGYEQNGEYLRGECSRTFHHS